MGLSEPGVLLNLGSSPFWPWEVGQVAGGPRHLGTGTHLACLGLRLWASAQPYLWLSLTVFKGDEPDKCGAHGFGVAYRALVSRLTNQDT